MSSAIGDNRTDQRNLPGLADETGSEANQPTEMHLGCTFDEGGETISTCPANRKSRKQMRRFNFDAMFRCHGSRSTFGGRHMGEI